MVVAGAGDAPDRNGGATTAGESAVGRAVDRDAHRRRAVTGVAHRGIHSLEVAELALAGHRFDAFAESWADAFPAGLGKNIEIYRGFGDIHRLKEEFGGVWVSGEAAVPELVRGGESVQLYLEDPDDAARIIRACRIRSSPEGTITLRQAFWDLDVVQQQALVVAQESASLGGRPQVPLALLYADLWTAGDPRLAEIAQEIRQRMNDRGNW